jgi:hypothetical protein
MGDAPMETSKSQVALWALVVALLATQVVIAMRLVKVQDQLSRIEERPAAAAPSGNAAGAPAGGLTASTGSASAGDPAPGSSHATDAADVRAAGPADPPPDGAAPVKPKRNDPVDPDAAVCAKDVEKMIEKALAERDKKNPLAQIFEFEDPMVVMERELKLSPIQKSRIQQHWKERDDAMMDVWGTEEARKDWREASRKVEELQKTCDENVRRELDLAQQEKYDDLKKKGKLHDWGGGGVSVMINKSEQKAEGESK